MKKRTISKLKSLFSSKKGKRQHQLEQSSKSSRSPSPEPTRAASPVPDDYDESYGPLQGSPLPNRQPRPPSLLVPTQPVAPVPPEPSEPLPLLPCAVCGRTFVPQSLEKHVKICEKMTVKKRKTFDSSRQRREGTELEQYLPKNFGLPKSSPFLEKSSPKPTAKPKPQSIRTVITKPMAGLQKCPHCYRAFGVRAFERHVEWCADKAKILPASTGQAPPHISEAKQRLNARTQYKAPPVRGRRSSETRDKSSNSRSASVESSRGAPSPQPREYGDYKVGRTRASESVSSNDCHDELSPHMPVIRNPRNSQNSFIGDANVKARQARLAKDLSSSRKTQDTHLSSAKQSNTDPSMKINRPSKTESNIKKSHSRTESNVKKQNDTEPNINKVQESLTDPHIKKNHRSGTDTSIRKKQQHNTDTRINKSQQRYTDTSIIKSQVGNTDTSINKSQQGSTETIIRKNKQGDTESSIMKSQQDNTEIIISKIQQGNSDTSIHKSQQGNMDTSIKKNQQGNTDTSIHKSQQGNTDTSIHKSQQGNTDLSVKNIEENSTDPIVKKTLSQTRLSKINVRKQQKLQKLEEIVQKYKDKTKNTTDVSKKSLKSTRDRSQLPIPNKSNVKKTKRALNEFDIDQLISKDIKEMNSSEVNIKTSEASDTTVNNKADKVNKMKTKTTKDNMKMVKENSMSLDSLEDCTSTAVDSNQNQNYQSIGINTLLCVPCVIHNTANKTITNRKNMSDKKDKKSAEELKSNNIISEPKIELLYKNPVILNSVQQTHHKDPYLTQDSINLNFDSSIVTPSTSENCISDEIEAILDFNNQEIIDNSLNSPIVDVDNQILNLNISESNRDSISEKTDEDIRNLSGEQFGEKFDRESVELSCESMENYIHDDNIKETNEIECRHGSGETYTKFTEDPADLDEFMNITDKLLSNDHSERECFNIDKDIDSLHTPTTNSIEAINQLSDVPINESPKHQFSDTFGELKTQLRELLEGAGNTVSEVLKKTEETNKDTTSITLSDANWKISDMEHVTIYQLKSCDKAAEEKNYADDESPCLKLPSIAESNKSRDKVECNNKRLKNIYKPKRKFKMLGEQTRSNKEYQTFIVNLNSNENCDEQSESSDVPSLKLPQIENRRLDDTYDPFVSAARQMKELMSSDINIPKKIHTTKDHSRTLPALQPGKDKGPSSYLRSDNSKMIKDTLNKTYQKTPTLQRMKSFGSTNNENSSNTFGGRCSSFRLNRNDKKPSPKLNTTFTKSSKENISTVEKNYFNRNSNLNRSFSSYTASSYSTPKPKDKIPKIATSMYHSFQRTTINQPVKLDKIKRDDDKKDFVNLDVILADENSSMTDSNYIDPRLINENDNLPINVNTILNNPDIISSMESLLTTENLPKKFESFSTVNQNDNKNFNNNITLSNKTVKNEPNNNISKTTAPTNDDLSMQYDKLMYSLEQSIASKTSTRDDDSLCEDFDLEDFMTSFDEEVNKQKIENKRTCSSTTRIVKQSQLADSNRTSELNSITSSPKVNGMNPVNKSMSLNFSSNIVTENLFPSSVKRSTSFLDSIQKKNTLKMDSGKRDIKSDQLEHDLVQSLKDFVKFYENDENDNQSSKAAKRDSRMKTERKIKKIENISNRNLTPTGKQSNDSAYSSLNRISPSKLSLCTSKEPSNGLTSIEQNPAGSESGGSNKEDARSISSEEFLAMERSAELDEPLPPPDLLYKENDNHISSTENRASSRASVSWRPHGSLSSSSSEASLARRRDPTPRTRRFSRFCHECGRKFTIDTAKFCTHCGVKRLVL